MTELKYNGRPMREQPVNMSLYDVAETMYEGHTVAVQLEPGDGTHYLVVIMPLMGDNLWSAFGRFGVTPDDAHNWMFVTLILGTKMASMLVSRRLKLFPNDVEELSMGNLWTAQLLAWWFNELRAVALPQTEDGAA